MLAKAGKPLLSASKSIQRDFLASICIGALVLRRLAAASLLNPAVLKTGVIAIAVITVSSWVKFLRNKVEFQSMDTLFSNQSIGISDLREAPARMFELAGETPVVVLNHNRPAGYIVSTQLMARILEQLADRVITAKASGRLATLHSARKITLDAL